MLLENVTYYFVLGYVIVVVAEKVFYCTEYSHLIR
jgi:hypothetical protein